MAGSFYGQRKPVHTVGPGSVLHTPDHQTTTNFPTYGPGFETPTSEVGGKCVINAPL